MLLYRPFFSKSPDTSGAFSKDGDLSGDPELADSIACHGLVACVKAAQQMIELISTNLGSRDRTPLLPPWWHVISYSYNAGTIVIAAHLFPTILEWVSVSALTVSVRQAFGILQHYENSRKSAQRCKSSLGILYEKIMSSGARQSPNGTLVTPDMTAHNYDVDFDLPADFFQDTNSSDFFDGTELLWLNSAPFDPENNFWL